MDQMIKHLNFRANKSIFNFGLKILVRQTEKLKCQQNCHFCLVCKILLKKLRKTVLLYFQQRLFLVQQRRKKESRIQQAEKKILQQLYCSIINFFFSSSPQFSCQAQRPASWYERHRNLRMRRHW